MECAVHGQSYAADAAAPVRGDAPADPVVPADAVTASGSGPGPDISLAYARLQAPRVARVRHLSLRRVLGLVEEHTTGRTLGCMGAPHVDAWEPRMSMWWSSIAVVELNRGLDRRYPFRG
ncbi:potassium-transporting ATPase subunit C [Streptomyces sp. NPDC048411]|uniref:potassium-transporting ATPase subunit C n=1 Tax=Streptomyces sp. NPDC048411 TaxID=3157206 RepID=UPI003456B5B6